MTASGRFPGQKTNAMGDLDPQRGRMVSQPTAPTRPAAPPPRRERVTVTNGSDGEPRAEHGHRKKAPRLSGFVVRSF